MRRIASLLLGIFIIFCAVIATGRPAWSYVDLGSGMLALQGIASVMGTVAYYFRRRLRTLFGSKPSPEPVPYSAKARTTPQNVA